MIFLSVYCQPWLCLFLLITKNVFPYCPIVYGQTWLFPYWLFTNMLMFLNSYSQEFALKQILIVCVQKSLLSLLFLAKMMISQMCIGQNGKQMLFSLLFMAKTMFSILFVTKNAYFPYLLFMAKTDYFPYRVWPKMVSFIIAYV